MAYTLNLGFFDLAEYYGGGFPTFAGSVLNPRLVGGNGAAFDTATTSPAAPTTLSFTSTAVPPATPSAVLATDNGTGGDVVRSGVVAALPPSPGTATVLTVGPITLPAPEVSAATAGKAMPSTVVPDGLRVLSGILTVGAFIPLEAVFGDPTVTLGSGTIDVTVSGSLIVRYWYFSDRTVDISVTATVTPTPSNDAEVPSHVLRTPLTTSSLTAALSGVPFGLKVFLASAVAAKFESAVNEAIAARARAFLRNRGRQLTPSAVICARSVTVVPDTSPSGGGVNLQLTVSDLFGPGTVPIPGALTVTISPTPQAAVPRTYTVTVKDAATGSPVPMATVRLRNYAANGAWANETRTTDAAGQAVFAVTLRFKVTSVVVISSIDTGGGREPDSESVKIPPTLAVDAPGYDGVRIALLQPP
jgi:hypothetical protein